MDAEKTTATAKRCCTCGDIKPTSCFYKNKSTNDGLHSQCSVCKKKSDRKWNQTASGRAYYRISSSKWKKSNSNKVRAQQALQNAVRGGHITRPTICSLCGVYGNIEAHHSSYEKCEWLNVEWLCGKCHHALHNAISLERSK